jgi:DNA-directed RNA polymerase specialized sigma24 family protein
VAGSDADREDAELPGLLRENRSAAWRVFIDRHTPTLVALLERAGLRNRDEAMEVYTLVCEHLAADGCARLKRWDPSRGALRSWLAVVVQRIIVDWVRSRAGRRRMFAVVKQLEPNDRRVFELFYWEGRQASEMAEILTVERGFEVRLIDVLASLDRLHEALDERHYGDLLSMAARSATPASIEAEYEAGRIDPADPRSLEEDLAGRERSEMVERALRSLPAQDAAIVRLHYFEGLSLADVRRALHLPALSRETVAAILHQLKGQLA